MIKYTSVLLSIIVAAALSLSSCGDNEGPGGSSEEQLQAYFSENNITPEQTSTGLYYVIDNPGGTEKPTPTSTVTVIYRGYFLDGGDFDSSNDLPITFSLRTVIRGWQEGIPLFGRGGTGTLFIPFELAYGSVGQGDIPGNTAIAFDIEVLDF